MKSLSYILAGLFLFFFLDAYPPWLRDGLRCLPVPEQWNFLSIWLRLLNREVRSSDGQTLMTLVTRRVWMAVHLVLGSIFDGISRSSPLELCHRRREVFPHGSHFPCLFV